jgi:predicted DsbA family dithiol-disulfide isomerase
MIVHPQVVTNAHLAGCAAAKQGKFKEFKDNWWEKAYKPHQMDDENLMAVAKMSGIDMARFKADMGGSECKERVDGDRAELAKFHVNSTPTFFVNGSRIGGALPKDAFKKIIDEKLKVAEASGIPGAAYYDKEIMAKGEKQFRAKDDPKPQ